MKYYKVKENLKGLRVFSPRDIYNTDNNFRLQTLYEWESKGLVVKLRNNKYIFSDYEPYDKDYYFISNKILQPSYISLESALSYYSVIPEEVFTTTAITTNKTNTFTNNVGVFKYSSVSKRLFFGYKIIKHNNLSIDIATIEKTVLDYLYLNSNIVSMEDLQELRWNKSILLETIDFKILNKYLAIFDNKLLKKRCNNFLNFIHA